MTNVFLLVLRPELAWKRILQDQRGVKFIFLGFLLPLTLIVLFVEGAGMASGRKWYVGVHGLIPITLQAAVVLESMHFVLTLIMIVSCDWMLWMLGDPFYSPHKFRQALAVIIYSLSPWLLFEPLSIVPGLNLWIPWMIGIFFSLRAFYGGMPRMLASVPGHALGLYLVSSAFIVAMTGAERYMFIQCLTGRGVSANNVIFDIAAKLPF